MRHAIVAAFLAAFSAVASATTIYVPDDFATIQAAIDASVNGDTILVRPGTYVEYINFNGKAIEVRSTSGAAVTTIDANQVWSVVTFNGGEGIDSVLEGFTLTGGIGFNNYGGGIYSDNSSPTITSCTITGNTAIWGGGIYCDGSSPAITANTIIGNSATFGGGVLCITSSSTITNNTITGNSATYGGGINCHLSSLTITNNIVKGNSANYGGGIHYSNSSPIITNNTITGNSADEGGGINCWDSDQHVMNTILWSNSAAMGKEIAVTRTSNLTITYSDVDGGQSSVFVDPGSTLNWGVGMIDADPLFFDPPSDDYHLQQDPCQPGVLNPCVDTGDPTSPLIDGSTRTDGVSDAIVVDMGYHYTTPASPQPNLIPWQPIGWSDKIVISAGAGTHQDSNLGAGQTAYIDFAEKNDGDAAVAHTTRLSIDGVTVVDEPVPALPAYGGQEWSDVTFVFPSPGTYRIQVEVDVLDDENNESDETDNVYWRDVEVFASASATFRGGGGNPPSYTAITLPVLGTDYECEVDLGGTTGHGFAQLFGFGSPLTLTLGGGQVLLVNPGDPSGELAGGPVDSGPVASFSLPIPADLALAGFPVFTQAVHFWGVRPFALSNAQDLTLGF